MLLIRFLPDAGKRQFCVYQLVNPADNRPYYVGCTSDVRSRARGHVESIAITSERLARVRLQRAIANKGLTAVMLVLKTYSRRGEAMRAESALIKELLSNAIPLLNFPSKHIVHSLAAHLAAVENCSPEVSDVAPVDGRIRSRK